VRKIWPLRPALGDVHGIAVLVIASRDVETAPASPICMFGFSEAVWDVVEQSRGVTFGAELNAWIVLSQKTDMYILREPLVRHELGIWASEIHRGGAHSRPRLYGILVEPVSRGDISHFAESKDHAELPMACLVQNSISKGGVLSPSQQSL
jgi:hypothetical protein